MIIFYLTWIYYFNIFYHNLCTIRKYKKKKTKNYFHLTDFHLLEILIEKNLPRFCQKKTIVITRHSNHCS